MSTEFPPFFKSDPLEPGQFPPLTGISTTADRAGVEGANQDGGPGVAGISKAGDGVFGQGANNGVVGRSKAANHSGVWADNTGGGTGVAGTSDAANGIGVFGRGGGRAGKFEGDVEVTGKLFLGGADIQQLIDSLQQQLQVLLARLDSTQPVFPPARGPSINVTRLGGNSYHVNGSNFSGNTSVILHVAGPNQSRQTKKLLTPTDVNGRLPDQDVQFGPLSGPLFFAATDGSPNEFDLTGKLWSNTVGNL